MPDHDPYDVVPDGFCEAWGEDTIPAALEAAERAGSTTPSETRVRCPECFTVKISPKPGHNAMPHKRDTAYKCDNSHHFDDPWPPACDVNFEWVEPADLEAEPELGSARYRRAIRRALELSKPWSDTDGRTLRETADYIPFSRAWVNTRRQEWRDGQHRDLVPAPLPATPDATTTTATAATDGGPE